ncbi:hypothetical protein M405DRAFT_935643 [Rhizopogon salebrosus TDB-379]|nr:hypothetical protein M405DRAFT_935643 [Rhizopogon salebrosus TDB-379]
MIKEQQAILDKIERERKDKVAQSSSSSSQPTAGTSESHTSGGRPTKHATWTPQEPTGSEHEPTDLLAMTTYHPATPRDTGKARARSVSSGVGSYKPPSTLDTTDRDLERPKPSPIIDELDSMPRSVRSIVDTQDSIRCGGLRRKASLSARQIPEFRVPPITPEEDAQMSHTFSMAHRGSTASATSSEGEGPHVGCGKEEEVRKKEAQARKRAEDLRRQEEKASKRLDEEARRIELDILRKSEEAACKENEVKQKEEEARLKEEEIQRKEEELARREEELPADLTISRRSNRRNFASVKKK